MPPREAFCFLIILFTISACSSTPVQLKRYGFPQLVDLSETLLNPCFNNQSKYFGQYLSDSLLPANDENPFPTFSTQLGDLTGDGLLDLFVAIMWFGRGEPIPPGFFLFANNGTAEKPSFASPVRFSNLTFPRTYDASCQPQLADVNGDQLLDVLLSYNSRVNAFINKGSGTSPSFSGPPISIGNAVADLACFAVNDLNGDNLFDLMLWFTNGTAQFAANSGTRTAPAFSMTNMSTVPGLQLNLADNGLSANFLDLDHDLDLDCVVGTVSGMFLVENRGTNTSFTFESLAQGANPFQSLSLQLVHYRSEAPTFPILSLGDLTGDANADALVITYTSELIATNFFSFPGYVFFFRSSGNSGVGSTIDSAPVSISGLSYNDSGFYRQNVMLSFADLNGDSFPDAFLSLKRKQVVFLGALNQTTEAPQPLSFQRDDSFTNQVAWPSAGLLNCPRNSSVVGDANNDGLADFISIIACDMEVVCNNLNAVQLVIIWYNIGNKSFPAFSDNQLGDWSFCFEPGGASTGVPAVSLFDFSGDGVGDLVLSFPIAIDNDSMNQAGFIYGLRGVGDGTFVKKTILIAKFGYLYQSFEGPAFTSVTIDFNSDGLPDVLLTSADGYIRLLCEGLSNGSFVVQSSRGTLDSPYRGNGPQRPPTSHMQCSDPLERFSLFGMSSLSVIDIDFDGDVDFVFALLLQTSVQGGQFGFYRNLASDCLSNCNQRGACGALTGDLLTSPSLAVSSALSCACNEGFEGDQCERCSPGYFGPRSSVNWSMSCAPCPTGYASNASGSLSCTICGPGFYAASQASRSCLPCPSGSFCASTGCAQCMPCAAGEFQPLPGQQSCSSCPTNSFASNGSATCTACLPGYVLNASVTGCEPCPAGSAATVTNSSVACSPCPAGSYAGDQARTSCALCPAGSFANSTGASACSPCSPGSFSPAPGAQTCQLCDESAGQYNPQSGQLSCLRCGGVVSGAAQTCTDCLPGTFLAADRRSCEPCAPNTYSDANNSLACATCPIGYILNANQSGCTPCPAGFFANVTVEGAKCSPCQAGSFAGDQARTSCSLCPSGSFANSTGASACSPCSPGSFSPAPGAQTCQLCDASAGQYSPSPGQVGCLRCGGVVNRTLQSCVDCPPATFIASDRLSCLPCPPNAYSSGNNSVSCTQCPPGFLVQDGGVGCAACPGGSFANITASGAECDSCPSGKYSPLPEGNPACADAPVGTYVINVTQRPQQCPKGFQCERGEARTIRDFWPYVTLDSQGAVQFSAAMCPPGYCQAGSSPYSIQCTAHRLNSTQNYLCGQCEEGYINQMGRCTRCEKGSAWRISLFFLLMVVVLVVFHKLSQSASGTSRAFFFFTSACPLVLGHFFTYFYFPFIVHFASLSTTGHSAFCIYPFGNAYLFTASVWLPAVGVGIFLLIWSFLVCVVSRSTRAKNSCDKILKWCHVVEASPDSAPDSDYRLLDEERSADRSSRFCTTAFKRTMLGFVIILYTNLLETGVAVWQIHYVNGVGVVFSFPAIHKSTGEYVSLCVVSFVSLLLVIVIHIGVAILACPKQLERCFGSSCRWLTESVMVTLVTEPYEKHAAFWEPLALLRRTLLTLVSLLIISPSFRNQMQLALSMIYLLAHSIVWPYRSRRDNVVEFLFLTLLVLVCIVNVGLLDADGLSEVNKVILSILITLPVSLAVLAAVLASILAAYRLCRGSCVCQACPLTCQCQSKSAPDDDQALALS